MKQQTVGPEVHEQRQQIIRGIADKYTDLRGRVELSKAFEENPPYRGQLAALGLDTPVRLNAYVLHMRRKGLIVGKKKVKPVRGPRKSPADYSLVHHIARSYQRDWQRGFAEHPDWAKRLGYPKKKAMSFVYRAMKLPDPGVPFEGQPAPALPSVENVGASNCLICGFVASGEDRWRLLAEHYGEKHSRPVKAPAPEPLPFNYCPKCGVNLLMFLTAFRVANKHSQNGGHES